MAPSDSDGTAPDPTGGARVDSAVAPGAEPGGPLAAVNRPGRLWATALLAGVLAGLLGWMGGEVAWGQLRKAQTPALVPYPTAADRDRIIHGMVRTAAVSFIQQGAILGAVLGLAGGLVRRTVRSALWAGLVGGGLGAVAAAGTPISCCQYIFGTSIPRAMHSCFRY